MDDPIWRAECANCSSSFTSSNDYAAERWTDDHIDANSDQVVLLRELKESL